MHLYLELFLTLMKVGLFTFGGGYAMISIIENICVEQKKWISHEEMMEITVIAESTPAPLPSMPPPMWATNRRASPAPSSPQ